MKKLVSLVLLMVLVLSLCPMQSSANNTIDHVSVLIDSPESGAYPDYEPVIVGEENYVVLGVYWGRVVSEDIITELSEGSYFQEGALYEVEITIYPKIGYEFEGSCVYRINGQAARIRLTEDDAVHISLFLAPPISQARVSITPPYAGVTPDFYPVIPGGEHYYNYYYNESNHSIQIDKAAWFDETEEHYLDESEVFIAGHIYNVRINLYPWPYFEFAYDTSAKVNGMTATAELRDSIDGDYLCVSYTFPATVGAKGWFKKNGYYYYYRNGSKVTGWQKIDGVWYYFSVSGELQTEWIYSGSNLVYFDMNSWSWASGWKWLDGMWLYFDPSTHFLCEGWLWSGNNIVYFDLSHWSYASGWEEIDGMWYYFEPLSYHLQTGWIWSGSDIVYFDINTWSWASGWKQIDGMWYYFKPSTLALQTGWVVSGGNYYYFDISTWSWASGWKQIDGVWCYFNPATLALRLN